MIDETTIITQYFAIILESQSRLWHVVLFEGVLLIKITTIQCCLYLDSTALIGVLIKDVVLIEEIRYPQPCSNEQSVKSTGSYEIKFMDLQNFGRVNFGESKIHLPKLSIANVLYYVVMLSV